MRDRPDFNTYTNPSGLSVRGPYSVDFWEQLLFRVAADFLKLNAHRLRSANRRLNCCDCATARVHSIAAKPAAFESGDVDVTILALCESCTSPFLHSRRTAILTLDPEAN